MLQVQARLRGLIEHNSLVTGTHYRPVRRGNTRPMEAFISLPVRIFTHILPVSVRFYLVLLICQDQVPAPLRNHRSRLLPDVRM